MNKNKIISATLVGLILAAGSAFAVGGVAAQTQDGCNPLVDDCDVDWSAVADGVLDRVLNDVASANTFSSDETKNASVVSDSVASEVNDSSGQYVDYYNKHISQTIVENDTHRTRLVFINSAGDASTKFIEAEFNSSEMVSFNVVDSATTYDDSCTIEGQAFDDASSFVTEFENQYITEDETPSNKFMTKNYVQYEDDFSCSFNIANK